MLALGKNKISMNLTGEALGECRVLGLCPPLRGGQSLCNYCNLVSCLYFYIK